jgi:hypothetical protein
MIQSHPDVFSYAMLAIAVLSHFAKEKYSPVRFRTNWGAGWFELKNDYDASDMTVFTLLMPIKWMAIGSMLTVQALT